MCYFTEIFTLDSEKDGGDKELFRYVLCIPISAYVHLSPTLSVP